jgi:hypothetical protein
MKRVIDEVHFEMPGPGGESLGKEIAMTIIRGRGRGEYGGIMGRCAQGVTPEGDKWPENSREYADEKRREYGWDETNRRTNQMLSQESLYGRTTVSRDAVRLVYGTGQPPTVSKAPTGHLSDQDRGVTDVEKAAFAHAQGRSFYGMNAEDEANVTAVFLEAVDRHIRTKG